MNVSILPNCRARRNRASERVNERKSEHIIVKKKEMEKERERERKREKKFDTRKRAFPFDDDVKKKRPTSFSLIPSLFSSFAHQA